MSIRRTFEAGASFDSPEEIYSSLLVLLRFGRTADRVSIAKFAQALADSLELPDGFLDDFLADLEEPFDAAEIESLIRKFDNQLGEAGLTFEPAETAEIFFRSAWDIIMPPRLDPEVQEPPPEPEPLPEPPPEVQAFAVAFSAAMHRPSP